MSRIDDLIADLCPDGVESMPLGSLGKRNKGTSITAGKMKVIQNASGPVRVFAGGQTVADVAEESVPSKDVIRIPSIIVKSRGHIGFTYYDKPFSHKAELWSYSISRSDIDQKFVYYYLLTKVGLLQEIARATSVKLPQLGVKDTDNLPIPLPPLEVQREIVAILDTFTELEAGLEAELEAELEARKRQYEYYRDALLRLDGKSGIKWIDELCPDGVERKTLGDVAVFRRGTSMTRKDTGDGRIPVIAGGRTPAYYHDKSNRTGESIVVAGSGAYAGFVTFWTTPIFVSDAFSVHPDADLLLPKYVYYFLLARQSEIHEKKSGGGVPHVKGGDLSPFPIPLPPLEVQREIVNVLDKFDALVNDLSIGLPAELAARRKQYEYYRDQLLTFKEAI